MANLDFLSCSATAGMTVQLLCMLHSCASSSGLPVARSSRESLLLENMYVMCTAKKLNRSTSLENDNTCYVSFKIWEQECVPWCGEIQNQRLEVLGKTFNLHSNSTWCPRCVVSQSVFKERIKSVQHSHKNILFHMRTLMKRLNEKSLMKNPYINFVCFFPYIQMII